MSDAENRVQWVYSSRDAEELRRRYDEWAKEYDQDLERDFDWQGPSLAVDYFAKYVATSAHILDAGAGTGLVGVELHKRGYHDLIAMDMSEGMLEEARKKGVYRQFDRMVLGEPLTYGDGEFDAVISVGVLTLGHAPAHSLDEMVRITRSGGHIVFSLRPDVYEQSGFREKQSALVDTGLWKVVEVSPEVRILPKGEPEVAHQVWVYQVA